MILFFLPRSGNHLGGSFYAGFIYSQKDDKTTEVFTDNFTFRCGYFDLDLWLFYGIFSKYDLFDHHYGDSTNFLFVKLT